MYFIFYFYFYFLKKIFFPIGHVFQKASCTIVQPIDDYNDRLWLKWIETSR